MQDAEGAPMTSRSRRDDGEPHQPPYDATTCCSSNDGSSGYEGDDENCTASRRPPDLCGVRQQLAKSSSPSNHLDRHHHHHHHQQQQQNRQVTSKGGPWTTSSSRQFVTYPVPRNSYPFLQNVKVRRRLRNDVGERMVLEPKFVDYGSIHPTADVPQLQQHNSSHALLSPRSVHSAAPADDEETEPPNTSKGTKMTQGDLYQRQPLLPTPSGKRSNGTHPSTHAEYFGEDEDEIMHKSTDSNGVIKINMPTPIREEPRFPQERWKTLIAALVMFFNFVLTLTSLSLVHERVPDRSVYGPLPDIILDNVPAMDWALNVSEYIIIVSVNSALLAILFHKHRFIVFRRIFLIMSLLYMYRAVTMYVTVLPLSSRTYYCSPKTNDTTPLIVVKRVIQLFSGLGLSVNGKHTYCGDFIYSGHTVILVLSYLFIAEYTPKKLYLVHWLYWLMAVVGVVMVQLAHGHYTVDIIIAYFITTRLFWLYHTLANNANLKQHSPNNLLGREWWFCLFLYFEGNVGGPVPRQFDWPLPWPRRFHSKSRES